MVKLKMHDHKASTSKNRHIVLSSKRKHASSNGILVIKEKSISHLTRLYQRHGLQPEAQEKITVEFILQKNEYLRHIIKELDILLKVNGVFEIILVDSMSHSRYYRSREQVKYEFSIATNGRYRLVSSINANGVLKLSYVKQKLALPEDDSINKWSFGIVSNGQKSNWVLELINSIEFQKIPEYEIVICGPSPFDDNHPHENDHIRILNDVLLKDDVRAPIAHKKNVIIKESKFNNLCILHDRYLLPKKWFDRFKQYGNYFDVLCLKNLNSDNARFGVDWMKFYYPLTARFKINRALAYDEWHEDAIIPGGVIVAKKNLIEGFRLDERLHWDELEDMQLSKVAFLNGLLINVDPNNHFISRQVRHVPQASSWLYLMVYSKLIWMRSVISNYFRYKMRVKEFYK
jgi:hypothetical protein